MTINIRIVDADEWQGVYVDGALEEQYQSIDFMRVVELMKTCQTFDVERLVLSGKGIDYVEENGFPDHIGDFEDSDFEN